MAALSPGSAFNKFYIPGVTAGAILSFSFYLTHKAMMRLAVDWCGRHAIKDRPALGIIVLACACASAALYFLVERPCLKWRDKLLRRI